MAVSEDFRIYVEEQLGRIVPVTTRRMFSGLGVYGRGLFFALAHDNVLYFKAGDANLRDFEERGCALFRPYGDERTMRYRELPGDVLEDPDVLRDWVEKALRVAEEARRERS